MGKVKEGSELPAKPILVNPVPTRAEKRRTGEARQPETEEHKERPAGEAVRARARTIVDDEDWQSRHDVRTRAR